jgi:hypothetical protein
LVAKNGSVTAVARTLTIAGGRLVVGGNFHQFWLGSNWQSRYGFAAFTLGGSLETWSPLNFINTLISAEAILALLADDVNQEIWVGGNFATPTVKPHFNRFDYP